ncbi:MAG: SpoIID/LytB domain protein, partial [Acidimicrobiales bacterium]|nr:SpoIID/LytB domain protein [Acidimicrobiales bacterium]
MRRPFPWRTLAAVLAVTVTMEFGALGGAEAAPSRSKPKSSPKPAAPPPGWTVDRARFELLDPSGELDVPGGGSYRGALVVRPVASGGGLATVNEVGLDDYVRGIAEVPSGWPAEALKAQAIAARTYALNQLAANKELCATDACQVYAGLAKERSDPAGSWSQAVTTTSGQVLLYKNAPILAMYSSSNGGRSVPGSRPYLRAVADPDDAVSPLHNWQSAVSFATLASVFGSPGPVVGIEKTDHDTYALAWQAPDGTGGMGLQEVPTPDFVTRLNGSQPAPVGLPLLLPSWRFDLLVDPVAATVTFSGRGFGHGVGMSQYGALGKAERGMKAPDILAAYYGGLKPVQLPPQALPAVVPVTLADGASAAQVASPGRFRVL